MYYFDLARLHCTWSKVVNNPDLIQGALGRVWEFQRLGFSDRIDNRSLQHGEIMFRKVSLSLPKDILLQDREVLRSSIFQKFKIKDQCRFTQVPILERIYPVSINSRRNVHGELF